MSSSCIESLIEFYKEEACPFHPFVSTGLAGKPVLFNDTGDLPQDRWDFLALFRSAPTPLRTFSTKALVLMRKSRAS
jgi:hypothetical protein